MPTSNSTDAAPPLISGGSFRAQRTADGVTLHFPVMRAPAAALSLGFFSFICAALPAIGLSALLPIGNASASSMVALALIGGLAAPFVLAAIVFGTLAIYMLANALTVDVRRSVIRSERRVFGLLTQRREIAAADIADIEPRIGARFQNAFSSTPRYALIARHRVDHRRDVTIAEDLVGQALMTEMHTLIAGVLDKKHQ